MENCPLTSLVEGGIWYPQGYTIRCEFPEHRHQKFDPRHVNAASTLTVQTVQKREEQWCLKIEVKVINMGKFILPIVRNWAYGLGLVCSVQQCRSNSPTVNLVWLHMSPHSSIAVSMWQQLSKLESTICSTSVFSSLIKKGLIYLFWIRIHPLCWSLVSIFFLKKNPKQALLNAPIYFIFGRFSWLLLWVGKLYQCL